MTFGHGVPAPKEIYTEDTLFKVYDALREDVSLTEKQTRACIDAMRKRGILFREAAPAVAPAGPVYRGTQEGDVRVGTSDDESAAS